MNQNITTSLENLPEFLSSTHLVSLGIYKSIDSAYQARMNGHSPQFIKLAHKVLYPKRAVIEFLEKHTRKGDDVAECDAVAVQNDE